jgi:hypothetical protein
MAMNTEIKINMENVSDMHKRVTIDIKNAPIYLVSLKLVQEQIQQLIAAEEEAHIQKQIQRLIAGAEEKAAKEEARAEAKKLISSVFDLFCRENRKYVEKGLDEEEIECHLFDNYMDLHDDERKYYEDKFNSHKY